MPACPATLSPFPALAELVTRVGREGEAFLPAARKAAVRDMLRHGKYKPAGRAKPSSEYLLAAAMAGEFPYVNGPVDANNAASLEWGYPASVFDLAKTGRELELSRGRAGESFVFNLSGQTIDIEDLVVVRRRVGEAWEACGNPVKDAMATKVFEDCRDAAGLVYAPLSEGAAALEACALRYAEYLQTVCGAAEVGWRIV